jgi:nicotinic acid mononucleotide adenylyltransferase
VVDSNEAMPPMGSSSSQSPGLMPHVSRIHLNYDAMENQLRMMQDVLTTEQEDHRYTRESLNAFNAQMQVFMASMFSDMYVC